MSDNLELKYNVKIGADKIDVGGLKDELQKALASGLNTGQPLSASAKVRPNLDIAGLEKDAKLALEILAGVRQSIIELSATDQSKKELLPGLQKQINEVFSLTSALKELQKITSGIKNAGSLNDILKIGSQYSPREITKQISKLQSQIIKLEPYILKHRKDASNYFEKARLDNNNQTLYDKGKEAKYNQEQAAIRKAELANQIRELKEQEKLLKSYGRPNLGPDTANQIQQEQKRLKQIEEAEKRLYDAKKRIDAITKSNIPIGVDKKSESFIRDKIKSIQQETKELQKLEQVLGSNQDITRKINELENKRQKFQTQLDAIPIIRGNNREASKQRLNIDRKTIKQAEDSLSFEDKRDLLRIKHPNILKTLDEIQGSKDKEALIASKIYHNSLSAQSQTLKQNATSRYTINQYDRLAKEHAELVAASIQQLRVLAKAAQEAKEKLKADTKIAKQGEKLAQESVRKTQARERKELLDLSSPLALKTLPEIQGSKDKEALIASKTYHNALARQSQGIKESSSDPLAAQHYDRLAKEHAELVAASVQQLRVLAKAAEDAKEKIKADTKTSKQALDVFTLQDRKGLLELKNPQALKSLTQIYGSNDKTLLQSSSGYHNTLSQLYQNAKGFSTNKSAIAEYDLLAREHAQLVGAIKKQLAALSTSAKSASSTIKALDPQALRGKEIYERVVDPTHLKKEELAPVREYLTQNKPHLSEEVNKAITSGRPKEEIDRLTSSLAQQASDLATVNKLLKGYNSLLHEAGLTIRAFIRYAVGYQALYAIGGAIKGIVTASTDLDKALYNIKAISNETEEGMKKIENSIKSVASAFEFGTKEISAAALVLTQAGLSGEALSASLADVAKYSAATGTNLAEASKAVLTFEKLFKLPTSTISDQLTNAVNISRLQGSDLTSIANLGLQTPAKYGLSSASTLGAFSTLSNSGINPSTASTGLRTLLNELAAPDKKTLEGLQGVYAARGDYKSETEISTKFKELFSGPDGLVNVLKELKRVGADKGELGRAIDQRAENVLLPLVKNIDELERNTSRIRLGGSAQRGAETTILSFENASSRLHSVFDSLNHDVLEPLIHFAAKATNSLADGLAKLREGNLEEKATGGSPNAQRFGAALSVGYFASLLGKGGAAKAALGVGAGAVALGADAVGKGSGKESADVTSAVEKILNFLGIYSLFKGAIKVFGGGFEKLFVGFSAISGGLGKAGAALAGVAAKVPAFISRIPAILSSIPVLLGSLVSLGGLAAAIPVVAAALAGLALYKGSKDVQASKAILEDKKRQASEAKSKALPYDKSAIGSVAYDFDELKKTVDTQPLDTSHSKAVGLLSQFTPLRSSTIDKANSGEALTDTERLYNEFKGLNPDNAIFQGQPEKNKEALKKLSQDMVTAAGYIFNGLNRAAIAHGEEAKEYAASLAAEEARQIRKKSSLVRGKLDTATQSKLEDLADRGQVGVLGEIVRQGGVNSHTPLGDSARSLLERAEKAKLEQDAKGKEAPAGGLSFNEAYLKNKAERDTEIGNNLARQQVHQIEGIPDFKKAEAELSKLESSGDFQKITEEGYLSKVQDYRRRSLEHEKNKATFEFDRILGQKESTSLFDLGLSSRDVRNAVSNIGKKEEYNSLVSQAEKQKALGPEGATGYIEAQKQLAALAKEAGLTEERVALSARHNEHFKEIIGKSDEVRAAYEKLTEATSQVAENTVKEAEETSKLYKSTQKARLEKEASLRDFDISKTKFDLEEAIKAGNGDKVHSLLNQQEGQLRAQSANKLDRELLDSPYDEETKKKLRAGAEQDLERQIFLEKRSAATSLYGQQISTAQGFADITKRQIDVDKGNKDPISAHRDIEAYLGQLKAINKLTYDQEIAEGKNVALAKKRYEAQEEEIKVMGQRLVQQKEQERSAAKIAVLERRKESISARLETSKDKAAELRTKYAEGKEAFAVAKDNLEYRDVPEKDRLDKQLFLAKGALERGDLKGASKESEKLRDSITNAVSSGQLDSRDAEYLLYSAEDTYTKANESAIKKQDSKTQELTASYDEVVAKLDELKTRSEDLTKLKVGFDEAAITKAMNDLLDKVQASANSKGVVVPVQIGTPAGLPAGTVQGQSKGGFSSFSDGKGLPSEVSKDGASYSDGGTGIPGVVRNGDTYSYTKIPASPLPPETSNPSPPTLPKVSPRDYTFLPGIAKDLLEGNRPALKTGVDKLSENTSQEPSANVTIVLPDGSQATGRYKQADLGSLKSGFNSLLQNEIGKYS
jgi:TP901 family phage tail tape measure protein